MAVQDAKLDGRNVMKPDRIVRDAYKLVLNANIRSRSNGTVALRDSHNMPLGAGE